MLAVIVGVTWWSDRGASPWLLLGLLVGGGFLIQVVLDDYAERSPEVREAEWMWLEAYRVEQGGKRLEVSVDTLMRPPYGRANP